MSTKQTTFSREDYLSKKCSHREYYAQFVDAGVIERVKQLVGTSRVKSSSDEHFNDIPLAMWDGLLRPCPARIDKKMRQLGDYPTLAGLVCVAKEAAHQIADGEYR